MSNLCRARFAIGSQRPVLDETYRYMQKALKHSKEQKNTV